MNEQPTIGLLLGGGTLATELVAYIKKNNLLHFIAALEDSADPQILADTNHKFFPISKAGRIIKALKKENIEQLILAGTINRPDFRAIRPDLTGVRLLGRIISEAQSGDNSILSIVLDFLEKQGFEIIGAQDLCPALLASHGNITKKSPNKRQREDIAQAIAISETLGSLDIGQSVVIQHGYVLGVEAAEGTDELIKRCGKLARKGSGPILVKRCKPTQDTRVDLPTIGLETIKNIYSQGFSGMAIHAEKSFLLDQTEVVQYAKEHNLFVIGMA